MAEQEMKSGANTGGSNVVVMEQSAGSRHKQPYRPTELQDEASDLHHKRSRAPAVPSVAEELKTLSEDTGNEIVDAKDGKENERGIPSEKYKHNVAKKLSSNTKKRANLPDSIEVEVRKAVMTPPPQPIPAQVETVASASGISMQDKHASEEEKKADEDSITEETDELRTAAETKHSEWSDDEEAGGLPRSESRASRMSRAVRQMFCCGVPYEAPSEDNISTARNYAAGI